MTGDRVVPRGEVERLRRRVDLWSAAARVLRVAVWQHDLVVDVGEWSDEARELYGVGEGPPSRDSFLAAVHADDREPLASALRKALGEPGEADVTHLHRVVRPSGEVLWLETRLHVDHDAAGRPVRFVGASYDRTETARTEEARRVEAPASPIIGEHALDAVFVANPSGRFEEVNQRACDMLGYAREELLDMTLYELMVADDVREVPPDFEMLDATTVHRRDRRLRHKDGGFVHVEISARRLVDGRVHAIVRDVSGRVAAERALYESEQTLRELGANLPGLLWVREVDSERLVYANAAWASVLEKPPVLGEAYWQLVKPVHRDDLPRLVVAPLRGSDQDRDEVVRFVLPDGTISWYRVCKFGIRDGTGRPNRVAGFAMDVTKERAAEEKIRASLREKEALLREIHHRVKNNLQIVSSLLRLQAATAKSPALSALLEESQSRVASMALVHEMLHRSADLSQIPFASYALALATSLAATYGVASERIAIEVDAADLALPVETAVSCGLLLNEIVSNSYKHAYPRGACGTIRVTLQLVEPSRYQLGVSDDGVGLPSDFDPRRCVSLGTKLIDSLAAHLDGTVTRKTSSLGTRYDVVFRSEPHEMRATGTRC